MHRVFPNVALGLFRLPYPGIPARSERWQNDETGHVLTVRDVRRAKHDGSFLVDLDVPATGLCASYIRPVDGDRFLCEWSRLT